MKLVATHTPALVEAAVGRGQGGEVKEHRLVPSEQRESGLAGLLDVPVSDQAVSSSPPQSLRPHLTGHQPNVLALDVTANGCEVRPAAYHPPLGQSGGSGVTPPCASRLGAQTQFEEDEPESPETHEGTEELRLCCSISRLKVFDTARSNREGRRRRQREHG